MTDYQVLSFPCRDYSANISRNTLNALGGALLVGLTGVWACRCGALRHPPLAVLRE